MLQLAFVIVVVLSTSEVRASGCNSTTVHNCMVNVKAQYPTIINSGNVTAPQLDTYCSDVASASGCLQNATCTLEEITSDNLGILDSWSNICGSPTDKMTFLYNQMCILRSRTHGSYLPCNHLVINPLDDATLCNNAKELVNCTFYAYAMDCSLVVAKLLTTYQINQDQPMVNKTACDLGYPEGHCDSATVTTCMTAVADFYPIISTSGNTTSSQLDNFCNDVTSASYCIVTHNCNQILTLPSNEGIIDGWGYVCRSAANKKVFLDNQQCIMKSRTQGGYKKCTADITTSSCNDLRALASCGYAAYFTECGNDTARLWSTYFIKAHQPMFDPALCILDNAVQNGYEYSQIITTTPTPTTPLHETATGNRNSIVPATFLIAAFIASIVSLI